MPFFFILHHLLPETETWKEGKRNCGTFLFGACLYAMVYVVVKNLQLRFGNRMDAVLSAFFMVLAADATTMGYVYKSHYGRSLLHELAVAGDPDTGGGWVQDEVTRKYRRPTVPEEMQQRIAHDKAELEWTHRYTAEIAELNAKLERENSFKELLQAKERNRAAKVIQRWWRRKLYNPTTGILYKRARSSFEATRAEDAAVSDVQVS